MRYQMCETMNHYKYMFALAFLYQTVEKYKRLGFTKQYNVNGTSVINQKNQGNVINLKTFPHIKQ